VEDFIDFTLFEWTGLFKNTKSKVKMATFLYPATNKIYFKKPKGIILFKHGMGVHSELYTHIA